MTKNNFQWTRVRTPNGYAYVKTRNSRPIEFSPTTGLFRVYVLPNDKSHSFETSLANSEEPTKSVGIQRTPDDHNAAVAKQKEADEYANRVSLTPERFAGILGASVPLAAGALGATVAAPMVFNNAIAPLSDYIAATRAGQFITKGLTNPYFTKGVESAFAAHGVNHAVNEGIKGPVDAVTTALEIAPLAQPLYKGFKYAWEAIPRNLNDLYDPYTSFSARFGYYGSPIERFYGTMSRRLNLPDKARSPELIRKLDKAFPIKRDGTLQIDAFPRRDFLRTNFTTDRPVVSHSTKNNWDHMDAYIVDPTVVDWRKAASIEPSDTFFPNLEITAKPNQVTLISGNKSALNEAKQLGTPTLSSIRLRQLYEQMLSYLPKLKSIPQKGGFKSNVPLELRKEYATEIQRLLTMRGTPTIKDYQYIENQTGLKSGVTLDNIRKNLLNQVNIAEENTTNIGDMTEDLYNKIYSFTFPNNTKIDGLRSLQAWNRLMLRMPFNKVQYNPATYAEDIWARQHGYK